MGGVVSSGGLSEMTPDGFIAEQSSLCQEAWFSRAPARRCVQARTFGAMRFLRNVAKGLSQC